MHSAKLLALCLSTAAVFSMSGCNAPTRTFVQWHEDGLPHHTQRFSRWHYQFIYHPDARVYFEPFTRVYYWNENGEWKSGHRLPEAVMLDHTRARVVYRRTQVPHPYDTTLMAAAETDLTAEEGEEFALDVTYAADGGERSAQKPDPDKAEKADDDVLPLETVKADEADKSDEKLPVEAKAVAAEKDEPAAKKAEVKANKPAAVTHVDEP